MEPFGAALARLQERSPRPFELTIPAVSHLAHEIRTRAEAWSVKPRIVALESNYKIAPMDQLGIKVFKSPDLTGDYDVDLAGRISLPFIGELDAANMTTAQLDERLTAKLGEKYLENPDVSVSIKRSTARVVTVDGAVRESGSFPVAGPMTLIQAVSLAKAL